MYSVLRIRCRDIKALVDERIRCRMAVLSRDTQIQKKLRFISELDVSNGAVDGT